MKKLILIFAIGFGAVTLIHCPVSYNLPDQTFRAGKTAFMMAGKPLTPLALAEALYYFKVDHPEIVFRQAMLETGNFTSKLCTRGNNLFGMRPSTRRETTATGKLWGYASYNHWSDSVRDYRNMQRWYQQKGYNMENYYAFLQKIGYAEDETYLRKLKSVF